MAKVVFTSSPHIPQAAWTEDLILSETEKSAALVCQSVNFHLRSPGIDPRIREDLANVLSRVGAIMISCSTKRADYVRKQRMAQAVENQARVAAQVQAATAHLQNVAVNSQLDQINQNLDTPD